MRRHVPPKVTTAPPTTKVPTTSSAPPETTTTTTTLTPPASNSVPAASAPATSTLLAQENFLSNVTSASPDTFNTVTGNLFSEAGGPTNPSSVGTIGVSADPEQSSDDSQPSTNMITTSWTLGGSGKTGSAQNGGFIGGWFNFTFTDLDTSANHVSELISVGGRNAVFVNSNEQLEYTPGGPVMATVSLNQWVFIGMAWVYNSSTLTMTTQIYTKLPGQSLNMVFVPPPTTGVTAPTAAGLDDIAGGGNAWWEGRVGTFFISSISTFGDVAMPSSVLDPVAQKLWFGVDPVNGNDSNNGIIIPIFAADGKTVIGFGPGSAPWKTQTRVNTALAYSGMFTQTVPWLNASTLTAADETQSATALEAEIVAGTVIRNPLIDELVIDTASGPFNISATGGINQSGGIQLYTNVNLSGFGSNVGSLTNVGDLEAFITIANNSWTLAPGATQTYETSNTAINAVLWQNRLWMNHILGTSFSQVEAQLESTPGSFWTDGTTMYVHPFGNTNPATDGNVYERSPGGTFSNAIGILVNVNDVYVHNIALGGTCGADESDNDPIGLYCVGTTSAGGLDYFDDLYLYYSSKHAFCWTDDQSNERVIVNSVDCEQGSVYAGSGGQYLFTSFNGSLTATGDQALYINCIANHSAGLIDSTAGQTLLNQGTFYSHNNGGSGQFSIISIINCDFDGSILCTSSIDNFVITNTTCYEIGSDALNLIADRDKTTYSIIRGPGTITNSIMVSQLVFGFGTNNNNFTGTSTYIGDVFDARNAAHQTEPSYFNSVGPSSITIRNSIFLATVGIIPIFDHFTSADTISMDHNIYDTAAGALVSENFTEGNADPTSFSLAQWQAIGYDTGSVAVADNAMNINLTTYIPYGPTPITNNLGVLDDMTGTIFSNRKSIGAYEYVPVSRGYVPPAGTGLH